MFYNIIYRPSRESSKIRRTCDIPPHQAPQHPRWMPKWWLQRRDSQRFLLGTCPTVGLPWVAPMKCSWQRSHFAQPLRIANSRVRQNQKTWKNYSQNCGMIMLWCVAVLNCWKIKSLLRLVFGKRLQNLGGCELHFASKLCWVHPGLWDVSSWTSWTMILYLLPRAWTTSSKTSRIESRTGSCNESYSVTKPCGVASCSPNLAN